MNVTMQPSGTPNIYIGSTSEYCDLEDLDRVLRTLRAARRWLVAEQKRRAAGEQPRKSPTVRVAK